jgi:menaquinol-cytochrome c reductase iron-sulfur subunit
MAKRTKRLTTDEGIPGAFEGETITRRRFMTASTHAAGAIAAGAIVLPDIGFAVGPVFHREPIRWQPVGAPEDFTHADYVPRTISLTADPVGGIADSTVFVRRRDGTIDVEHEDRWNQFIAISSRCAHVGCPVDFKAAAAVFICPCHGGVYDFRGLRIGGPPPRPLDRFFTRTRNGQVEVGPRYSVNSQLRRFSPRDPGETLDGVGPYLYPPRFDTSQFPK